MNPVAQGHPLVEIRCPACNRMACKASPGATVEVRCGGAGCRKLYTRIPGYTVNSLQEVESQEPHATA